MLRVYKEKKRWRFHQRFLHYKLPNPATYGSGVGATMVRSALCTVLPM